MAKIYFKNSWHLALKYPSIKKFFIATLLFYKSAVSSKNHFSKMSRQFINCSKFMQRTTGWMDTTVKWNCDKTTFGKNLKINYHKKPKWAKCYLVQRSQIESQLNGPDGWELRTQWNILSKYQEIIIKYPTVFSTLSRQHPLLRWGGFQNATPEWNSFDKSKWKFFIYIFTKNYFFEDLSGTFGVMTLCYYSI